MVRRREAQMRPWFSPVLAFILARTAHGLALDVVSILSGIQSRSGGSRRGIGGKLHWETTVGDDQAWQAAQDTPLLGNSTSGSLPRRSNNSTKTVHVMLSPLALPAAPLLLSQALPTAQALLVQEGRRRGAEKTISSQRGEPKTPEKDLTHMQATLKYSCVILGLPKFVWAMICNSLALFLVLLCIPLLLTVSRRRPPGAPLFDCAWGPVDKGEENRY